MPFLFLPPTLSYIHFEKLGAVRALEKHGAAGLSLFLPHTSRCIMRSLWSWAQQRCNRQCPSQGPAPRQVQRWDSLENSRSFRFIPVYRCSCRKISVKKISSRSSWVLGTKSVPQFQFRSCWWSSRSSQSPGTKDPAVLIWLLVLKNLVLPLTFHLELLWTAD